MKVRFAGLTLAGLAACFLPVMGFGQTPVLVDSAWLTQHLNDGGVAILHVGDAAGYAAGHIPGARQISVADVSQPGSLSVDPRNGTSKELAFELASDSALRQKFASLGVSDATPIVLYAGPRQPNPAVTRIAAVLQHLGLGQKLWLLNGGQAAWTNDGHPVTADAPPVVAGSIAPNTITKTSAKNGSENFVDADFVKSIPGRAGFKLIDARAANYFKGEEATFGKSGHIPGAVNIPFTTMADGAQKFDVERIAQVFKTAGVKPGDKLVVYCHIGMTATEVIFGARLLGYEAMLYDGSFQDWAVNERGPVEK